MIANRSSAGSLVVNGGQDLLMVGGENQEGFLDTTEYINPWSVQTSRPGPKLPHPMAGMSLVQINSTTALMIGGDYDKPSSFFLDIEREEFIEGPPMNHNRILPACGRVVRDEEATYVFAIGGSNRTSFTTDTTEVWSSLTNEWTSGPTFPVSMTAAQVIPSPDQTSLFVLGGRPEDGFLDTIYKLAFHNGQLAWILMDQKLPIARAHYVAVDIPKDLAIC